MRILLLVLVIALAKSLEASSRQLVPSATVTASHFPGIGVAPAALALPADALLARQADQCASVCDTPADQDALTTLQDCTKLSCTCACYAILVQNLPCFRCVPAVKPLSDDVLATVLQQCEIATTFIFPASTVDGSSVTTSSTRPRLATDDPTATVDCTGSSSTAAVCAVPAPFDPSAAGPPSASVLTTAAGPVGTKMPTASSSASPDASRSLTNTATARSGDSSPSSGYKIVEDLEIRAALWLISAMVVAGGMW